MSRTAVNRFILPPGINIIQIPNSNAWIIGNTTTKRKQLINLPKNISLDLKEPETLEQNSMSFGHNETTAERRPSFSVNQQPRQNFKKETSTKKRRFKSLYALTRALVYNATMDSAHPSSKSIRVGGVGYYAELEKKPTCGDSCAGPEYILSLKLGYSHKVKLQVPKTLDIKIDKDSTTITISGIQRCFLGNFAAKVRAVSPIEPYHKKGLCYVNEVVRSKVAKSRKNKAKE